MNDAKPLTFLQGSEYTFSNEYHLTICHILIISVLFACVLSQIPLVLLADHIDGASIFYHFHLHDMLIVFELFKHYLCSRVLLVFAPCQELSTGVGVQHFDCKP
jgi:hypothetical protein